MERREQIERLARTEEDRLLLARAWERLEGAARRNVPAATAFLSPREQALVRRLLPGAEFRRFGGFAEAERAVFCYVPDYYAPEDFLTGEDGPIRAVAAEFYEGDRLTHRDFLGALMGAGIKRETVGDILVRPGLCQFLVTREIAPYVLQNLDAAGRTRLRLSPLSLAELAPPPEEGRLVRETVAALRLDCVAAAGFGLSRAAASQAVTAGRVAVNGLPVEKPDRPVAQGDKISIRGLGKIRLNEVGGTTRKGRTGVLIFRFL